MKNHLTVLLGTVLILGGVVFVFFSQKTANTGSLESISTSEAPWPAEVAHLRERLNAIHLPALTSEGQALHTHQHLDIFIHGQSVPVPADIGVNEGPGGFISSIHTHDTTAMIHVESPTIEKFYVGQFFDIWGVRLSQTCIGGYCADDKNTLTLYVNGTKYEGDPRTLELTAHEQITIVYGTLEEAPTTLPSSYIFPEGS
ncbi:MAG: hypothetical protein AAB472_00865 [Patescibacteria group bacterium]